MGKPATAYWCEKGHLTDTTASGEWSKIDMVLFDEEGDAESLKELSCGYCRSFAAAYTTLNWQDSEYCEKCYKKKKICFCGPTIKTQEKIKKHDIEGVEYTEYVFVYDCSMLDNRTPKNWSKNIKKE